MYIAVTCLHQTCPPLSSYPRQGSGSRWVLSWGASSKQRGPSTLTSNHTMNEITDLLKSIHTVLINIYHDKEQLWGVLLGVAPRAGQDIELIKGISAQKALQNKAIQMHADLKEYIYIYYSSLADWALPLWLEGSKGGYDGVVTRLVLDESVELLWGESDNRTPLIPAQQLAYAALQLCCILIFNYSHFGWINKLVQLKHNYEVNIHCLWHP